MSKFLLPKFESEIISSGEYDFVVGIDEVGRGCLAGPVAMGGYLFSKNNKIFHGIHDSKKLNEEAREKQYLKLSQHDFIVKYGSVEEIDKKGIGKALHKIIESIIQNFTEKYSNKNLLFLIDGQFAKDFGKNTRKLIKGDSTYYSIAAASILAKVERDSLMKELHNAHPEYGWNRNKGYATKFHREMIKRNGLSELHRKSFVVDELAEDIYLKLL
ncbi:MAG: ribonuclease HII [Candidatus Dojkabacteria bacterium]